MEIWTFSWQHITKDSKQLLVIIQSHQMQQQKYRCNFTTRTSDGCKIILQAVILDNGHTTHLNNKLKPSGRGQHNVVEITLQNLTNISHNTSQGQI